MAPLVKWCVIAPLVQWSVMAPIVQWCVMAPLVQLDDKELKPVTNPVFCLFVCFRPGVAGWAAGAGPVLSAWFLVVLCSYERSV